MAPWSDKAARGTPMAFDCHPAMSPALFMVRRDASYAA
jgi:hypothetical protein